MHRPRTNPSKPNSKFSPISILNTSLLLAPSIFNSPIFLSLISFNSLNRLAIKRTATKIKILSSLLLVTLLIDSFNLESSKFCITICGSSATSIPSFTQFPYRLFIPSLNLIRTV